MEREEVEGKILESIKEIFDVAKEYSDFDVIGIRIMNDEDGKYIVSVYNNHWNEGVKPIDFVSFSGTWEVRSMDSDATAAG